MPFFFLASFFSASFSPAAGAERPVLHRRRAAIRDGMDIVPFEYVVSRECRGLPVTVVLSEFAGCAR